MRRFLLVIVTLVWFPHLVFGQTVSLVDRFDVGSTVMLQGCVERASPSGAAIVTKLVTWPILRSRGSATPKIHFWTKEPIDLLQFENDTIQLTGSIHSMGGSEIETEPGLRRVGEHVEFEMRHRRMLIRPQTISLQLNGQVRKDDV